MTTAREALEAIAAKLNMKTTRIEYDVDGYAANDPRRADFETACLGDETLGPRCLVKTNASRLVVTRTDYWDYEPWNDSEVARVMDEIRKQLKPGEHFCVARTRDEEPISNRDDNTFYVYVDFGLLTPKRVGAEN